MQLNFYPVVSSNKSEIDLCKGNNNKDFCQISAHTMFSLQWIDIQIEGLTSHHIYRHGIALLWLEKSWYTCNKNEKYVVRCFSRRYSPNRSEMGNVFFAPIARALLFYEQLFLAGSNRIRVDKCDDNLICD